MTHVEWKHGSQEDTDEGNCDGSKIREGVNIVISIIQGFEGKGQLSHWKNTP